MSERDMCVCDLVYHLHSDLDDDAGSYLFQLMVTDWNRTLLLHFLGKRMSVRFPRWESHGLSIFPGRHDEETT
ncbi:unnamed protein product [Orchesella dallaii]|uniref:Uncharacterized protein n=1 Tax=Orchesella dallaii TaxID=48710 RepID=A0ABP1RIB5_9HEXA